MHGNIYLPDSQNVLQIYFDSPRMPRSRDAPVFLNRRLVLFLLFQSQFMVPGSTLSSAVLPVVSVYDGVISDLLITELDASARAVAEATTHSTVPHILVDRNQEPGDGPGGFVESVLDALLSEYDDKSRYVEWWWRDEWRNLDLHRDVDEFRARAAAMEAMMTSPMEAAAAGTTKRGDDDIFVCPRNGHVLYLDVGDEVQGGHTVLWTEDGEAATWSGGLKRVSHMVTCPAKPARLLRFAGTTYHSVPRPPLCYFDSEHGGTMGRIHARAARTPGDHESTAMKRSVILFNTWETAPDGFEFSSDEGGGSASAPLKSERCKPVRRDAWTEVTAVVDGSSHDVALHGRPPVRVKVPLLGDRQRRGTIENTFTTWASEAAVAAFTSTEDVHVVPVVSTW